MIFTCKKRIMKASIKHCSSGAGNTLERGQHVGGVDVANLSTGDVVREIEEANSDELRAFKRWASGGKELCEVYTHICSGDEWAGYALRVLAEMECGAWDENQQPRQWIASSEVWNECKARGLADDVNRCLQSGFLDLLDSSLIVAEVQNMSYRGAYVGAGLVARIHWPNVLGYWWHALREVFTPDGYVYLLGAPDFYKIGRAKNVDSRVKQLGIQLPWEIDLVHTIPCEDYISAERKLHRKFSDRRANGEWFMLTPDDVKWIKSIYRMYREGLEVWD